MPCRSSEQIPRKLGGRGRKNPKNGGVGWVGRAVRFVSIERLGPRVFGYEWTCVEVGEGPKSVQRLELVWLDLLGAGEAI